MSLGEFTPSPSASMSLTAADRKRQGSIFSDQGIELYKERLPRRRKKASDGCWGLSCPSWFFLILAFLQAVSVTGVQIAIAVLGRFREPHLSQYVECVEENLNDLGIGNGNGTTLIQQNTTFPTFGSDKEIYIYFFIALVVYNFFLCIYALKFQNIVEVYMFMVINILAMGYAGLQIFQFRGFGQNCDLITLVGFLALINVIMLFIFTFIFVFLSLFIYVEFGWKTYVLVDCNPAMRYYYRVYQVFMSVLKLFILFLVIFNVSQCILLFPPSNYEFGLSILLAIAAIVLFPIVYLIVTFEFILGAVGLLLIGIAFIVYFTFKTYRYISRTCPLCIRLSEQFEADFNEFINAFNPNSTEDQINQIRPLLNRGQTFENLVLLSVVSLLITLVLLAVFIHYWRQFRKGLKGYFFKQPIQQWAIRRLFCWCKCVANGAEGEDNDNNGGRILGKLRGRNKLVQQRNGVTDSSVISRNRDSDLQEPHDHSTIEPTFKLTPK